MFQNKAFGQMPLEQHLKREFFCVTGVKTQQQVVSSARLNEVFINGFLKQRRKNDAHGSSAFAMTGTVLAMRWPGPRKRRFNQSAKNGPPMKASKPTPLNSARTPV